MCVIVKDLNVLIVYYKVKHKLVKTTDEWCEINVCLSEVFKRVN